jgi:hypothetical protein
LSSFAPPKLCLWFLVCLTYFNSYYTQLPYQLIWIWLKLSWLKCINVRNLLCKSKKACLTSSKSLKTSHSDKKNHTDLFYFNLSRNILYINPCIIIHETQSLLWTVKVHCFCIPPVPSLYGYSFNCKPTGRTWLKSCRWCACTLCTMGGVLIWKVLL